MTTVIIATFDGHVNGSAFKTWPEARKFVESRIPENAFIQTDEKAPYWVRLRYIEEEGDVLSKHTWELNEVQLVKMGSS